MFNPVVSVSECAERRLDVLCTVRWSDKCDKEYGATFSEKVHVIERFISKVKIIVFTYAIPSVPVWVVYITST